MLCESASLDVAGCDDGGCAVQVTSGACLSRRYAVTEQLGLDKVGITTQEGSLKIL